MTPDVWGGFTAGTLVGFFVATVFASTKFWELWREKQGVEEEMRVLRITATHLQQQVHPFLWDDDGPTGVKVREQLYERHPELLQPGSEVVRIQADGDIPDLPAGWRESTAQGDEQ